MRAICIKIRFNTLKLYYYEKRAKFTRIKHSFFLGIFVIILRLCWIKRFFLNCVTLCKKSKLVNKNTSEHKKLYWSNKICAAKLIFVELVCLAFIFSLFFYSSFSEYIFKTLTKESVCTCEFFSSVFWVNL